MTNESGKKLKCILAGIAIIPMAIMSFTFFSFIGYSSDKELNEALYRFNENTSFDGIKMPIDEINQMLINITKILSSEEQLDNFTSPDSTLFYNKIATIMNSYSYLNNIMVVNNKDGSYNTYPEHMVFKSEFNPQQQPWYILNTSDRISYSEPYQSSHINNIFNTINSDPDVVITVSTPILNAEHKTLGVIASDLNLKKISDALKNKIVPLNGHFIVTTTNGLIINSLNQNEILTKKIPEEWLNKSINYHGRFHDSHGNIIFYKTYSNPNWKAFTYIEKENRDAYFNNSYCVFYISSMICLMIILTLIFLYNIYNKSIISKLYLDINGVDLASTSLDMSSLSNEIVKHREKYRQIQQDAFVDELTKLYNRKKLEETTAMLTSRGKPFYLAIIDLDNFKSINDQFGHIVGDGVLKFVAKVGMRTLGEDNPIYRFGGEEMVVILPEQDLDYCLACLEQWRLDVSLKEWREPGLKVSFSCGLTMWNKRELFEDAMSRVDQYLYRAKNSGKNTIIYSDEV